MGDAVACILSDVESKLVSDLYARKSVKDGGRSAARQERDWRTDCATQGFECGKTFVDPDLSASRFASKPRPDFANLIAHIKAGNSRMISMWEASRGSRQLHEWIAFLDLCRDMDVLIRIFGEGGHTYDPRRRRDYRDLVNEGLEAHDESSRLSERVTAGIRDAAAQGRPGGHALYGYQRRYGALESGDDDDGPRRREIIQIPDPTEKKIIRQMVADILADNPVSLREQARRLNAAGVPTPSGKGRWSGANIGRLLLNPGLTGDRVHHGVVIARDAWPEIITRDEQRRIRDILREPARLAASEGSRALKYPLVGAAMCGVCQRPLRSWRARTGLPAKYMCKNAGCGKVVGPAEEMEAVVDHVIRARLSQPDGKALFAPKRSTSEEAQRVQREIDDIREHLEEYYRLAETRQLTAEALARVERADLRDIARLEQRRSELETPPALRHLADVDVAGTWNDLPVFVRREVIQQLARVVLSPCGKGVRWTPWRLRKSRWHGDDLTWGQHWERNGIPRPS